MLMEMIENLEKEQEHGANEMNGIEQQESDEEDDDSSEVRELLLTVS